MGGLLGTATAEKSGLMSSDDKKFGLNRYLVTNRTFMKIMVGKNWERHGSLIYGNVNGFPYLVIISMYCSLNAPVYSVRWVIGETTKLKFYYKGFEVYVLFGYYENEPHYAFVQSSSGVEIISRGEDVGQGYTEITT